MTREWTCLEDGARAALNGQKRLVIRGGEEDDELLGEVGIVSSVTVKGAQNRGGCMKVCFAPCKGIQDSLGFWIPRRGFRIPGTGFKSLSVAVGFWISIVSGIPDSLSCISDSKAPENSGFRKHNFLGFRIQDSHPTWGEIVNV